MNTGNNTGLQGASGTHSRPKFSAAESGAEVRIVPNYVGDDKADWRLDEASRAPNAARALAILKQAAPRLGYLQAERVIDAREITNAFKQVGSRNGLSVGEDRLMLTRAEVDPLIREAFQTRAAEIALPHMAEARADIRAYFERHDSTRQGVDRIELKESVLYLAEECAKNLDIAHADIFDDLASAAGLTDEELNEHEFTEAEIVEDFDLRFDSIVAEAISKGQPADRASLLAREFEWRWERGTWRDVQLARIESLRLGWQRERHRGEIEWRGPPRRLVDPFAGANGRERFEVTMFGDIDEDATKEWLVDDMLGAGELSCFWGMPGCGKSVIVGDAAFHVASGLEWHGKPVKRGLVVFIAAERADLTKRRFAALRKRHGGAGIPLAVVRGRLDLTSSPQDTQDIVEQVRAIEDRTGEQCVWVIVDTVARTFGAGDENKQADMGAYIKACDLIRDELSAHLTLIHHCSRSGEKPRGSIALDGAVDATYRVSKSGLIHSVAVDKENDAPGAGSIRFRMEGVDVGTDSRGKVTTAPVAVPDTETVVAFDAGGVAVALKGPGFKARAVLRQALDEAGEDSPDGRRAVAVYELRRRLRDAFAKPGQKADSLATIERREFSGLTNRGDAERAGEWIMLPRAEIHPGGDDK